MKRFLAVSALTAIAAFIVFTPPAGAAEQCHVVRDDKPAFNPKGTPATELENSIVRCDPGYVATGGGFDHRSTDDVFRVFRVKFSQPFVEEIKKPAGNDNRNLGVPTGWHCQFVFRGEKTTPRVTDQLKYSCYAVCCPG